jgi:hypothetical protein
LAILLFQTIIPAEMNLGGASDRPLPGAIWNRVQKNLAEAASHSASGATNGEGLPLEDWEWLYKNYKPEYEMTAGWLKGVQAAGGLPDAPKPPY